MPISDSMLPVASLPLVFLVLVPKFVVCTEGGFTYILRYRLVGMGGGVSQSSWSFLLLETGGGGGGSFKCILDLIVVGEEDSDDSSLILSIKLSCAFVQSFH